MRRRSVLFIYLAGMVSFLGVAYAADPFDPDYFDDEPKKSANQLVRDNANTQAEIDQENTVLELSGTVPIGDEANLDSEEPAAGNPPTEVVSVSSGQQVVAAPVPPSAQTSSSETDLSNNPTNGAGDVVKPAMAALVPVAADARPPRFTYSMGVEGNDIITDTTYNGTMETEIEYITGQTGKAMTINGQNYGVVRINYYVTDTAFPAPATSGMSGRVHRWVRETYNQAGLLTSDDQNYNRAANGQLLSIHRIEWFGAGNPQNSDNTFLPGSQFFYDPTPP